MLNLGLWIEVGSQECMLDLMGWMEENKLGRKKIPGMCQLESEEREQHFVLEGRLGRWGRS